MQEPIKDYPMYEVTDDGRVWSRFYKIWLKFETASNGYLRIRLYNSFGSKKFPVHRLVADAFIENPYNKSQINHCDFNKQNNCIENLEWVTPSENQQHFYRHGDTTKRREASRKSVRIMLLTTMEKQAKRVMQFDKEGNYINEFLSTGKASIATGVQQTKISAVAIGKRATAGGFIWKYKEKLKIA